MQKGHFLPKSNVYLYSIDTKGQIISKADWLAIDSPKKRTDEFVFFALQSGNT